MTKEEAKLLISIPNAFYCKGGGLGKHFGVEPYEIEEEVIWLGSEIEVNHGKGWMPMSSYAKVRLKPKSDYTSEIEALQNKAKENGMKAVITFEKL